MGQKLLIMNEIVVFRRNRSEIHKRFLLNQVRLETEWRHLAWTSINIEMNHTELVPCG
jgi:hypothetical protein